MTAGVIVRRRVAVYGSVSDAVTGRPLAGARVEISQAPPAFAARLALQARAAGVRWQALEVRPDRARTAPDGHFHFMDLPAGTYTLTTSLPTAGSRYGSATGQATLTVDAQGTVSRARLDLKLPVTTVQGKVEAGRNPVRLAEVVVRGGPERAVTDDEGGYRLSGLEAGKRTLVVSARGFKNLSQTVALGPAGAATTADFILQPSPPSA